MMCYRRGNRSPRRKTSPPVNNPLENIVGIHEQQKTLKAVNNPLENIVEIHEQQKTLQA